jgi:hypothetical protein
MAMNTPHSSSHRPLLRALCALGLALIALATTAGGAGAHVSPAQAEDAATRGANWFRANQEASGSLTAIPGGIQPSRLSTSADAAKSNLVARIAELFDGTQIGEPGLLNDDIFGVLALHQAGAPQALLRKLADHLRTKQLPDGGWTWNTAPEAIADTLIPSKYV